MHSVFVEENYILPKLAYRFNAIAVTVSGFFPNTDTLMLKFAWKHESSRRAKRNLKKNEVGRIRLSQFRPH